MTDPICTYSARQLIAAFEAKALSPVEVMQAILAQFEKRNPAINALFGEDPEGALEQARASENRWYHDRPKGVLDGLPITVKDSVRVRGFPSWHGCRANMQNPLETEDAPPAARLKEAGAIIFAKTAMPDIGMLACGVSSAHGIVRNAWNTDFNPGGSSAGAATSVAAGIGPCSIGTDGGGSVRLPAAQCGLFGFKPTNGRIPHIPPDPIRSAGTLTRNVADSAFLMNVLAKPDNRDFGALPPVETDYLESLDRDLAGLKLGVMMDIGFGPATTDEMTAAISRGVKVFEKAGAILEPVSLAFDFDPMEPVERYFKTRSFLEFDTLTEEQKQQVLPYIAQWVAGATQITGIELADALAKIDRVRTIIRQRFENYDLILSPVMPMIGFPAEALGADNQNPIDHIGYTALYNQTGQPAASICCGFSENGLPIGLQIIGKRYDDLGVLQLSFVFEQQRELEIPWPMS